jgi:superfamily II DNA or RNA helicase
MDYSDFIAAKLSRVPPTGLQDVGEIAGPLFPHQEPLVRWALARGRAAIFADTGLGKTRMQLSWADAIYRTTGAHTLILAPLAVAAQTVREGADMGLTITHCREMSDVRDGINITNYDRLHKFNPSWFGAVVLDESSIIKHHTSRTLKTLLDAFRDTQFKLCATATPAPNDWTELGTHAEFLGICTQSEMLAEYFVHDSSKTQDWRLKGHARELFWRWVATWAAMVRKPSDLGLDDGPYILPPLVISEHHVETESQATEGMLFALEASSLSERRAAKRASLSGRVDACAAMVNADKQQWIVWCDLNDEGDALTAAIDGAVQVAGSDDADVKEQRMQDFSQGKIRVLVTKPKIAGWGMNWQHCARVAFVGATDSWESYYQSIRRCWRFGQKREVHAHIFASQLEGAIVANLKRKEADAKTMADALSAETLAAVQQSVLGMVRESNPYKPAKPIIAPAWLTSEAA